MRIANVDGRATIVLSPTSGADVHTASGGRFGPGLTDLYDRWDSFSAWAADAAPAADVELSPERLGAPSPRPPQVFAIGLNYAEHAKETGFDVPVELPPIFTKFPSSIAGPFTAVELPPGNVDWEVEIVAVIGRTCHRVTAAEAWEYVAGLTIGQDLSERVRQFSGQAPQFGLAKSFPGFSPMGPWLVTPDELDDRDDIRLGCSLDGETVQDGRTGQLLVSIPEGIAALSEVVTLMPGDVVFTGTPDGVGVGRTPPRFIEKGQTLESWAAGIGSMTQTFI